MNDKESKVLDKEQLDNVVGGDGCTEVKRVASFTYVDGTDILINIRTGDESLCKHWVCKCCGGGAINIKSVSSNTALYCSHCTSVVAVCDNCAHLKFNAWGHDKCTSPLVRADYNNMGS